MNRHEIAVYAWGNGGSRRYALRDNQENECEEIKLSLSQGVTAYRMTSKLNKLLAPSRKDSAVRVALQSLFPWQALAWQA